MKKIRGGSVYQRKDGMWVGSVELGLNENGKRVRRTVSSKDREMAEAKMRALSPNFGTPPKTRAEHMAAARLLGTHTAKEWGEKVDALRGPCRYCRTDLNMFNMVKDHMIAVEVGGSDSIDNLQPICWECNIQKARTPHDEYAYTGTKPRPFSIFPLRREMHAKMMQARKRVMA
jgi:5-methylcytosine-specific restriction endonuclease McrA